MIPVPDDTEGSRGPFWMLRAYGHFNEQLFDNELPACTLYIEEDLPGSAAYRTLYELDQITFVGHEIVVVMTRFELYDTVSILAAIAHEMTHLWQVHKLGNERPEYSHNPEWIEKMAQIGLPPYMRIEYKESPDLCLDTIAADGPFHNAMRSLLDERFIVPWGSMGLSWSSYNCYGCYQHVALTSGQSPTCGRCGDAKMQETPLIL